MSSLNRNLLKCGDEYYTLTGRISDRVFICEYKYTKQRLAIKRIDLDRMDDSQLEDIKKDTWLTRSIKHENIMPLLSCFVAGSSLCCVFPLAEYGSVAQLSQPKGLSELPIAYIVRDVLLALEYLHARGIVHRAVRGKHILVLGPQGKCLLTGFKYSTMMLHDGKWRQSIHQYPSNAECNLNWLSPELLEQNLLGYNCKSDIYSLGITCCELANGRIPFDNLQPTEMLLDKLTGNYPKPIDTTCVEFLELLTQGLTEDDRMRYETYRSRRFSDHFHSFIVDSCLLSDPHKRPAAFQLLNHSFLKQLKKQSSAMNLIVALGNLDSMPLPINYMHKGFTGREPQAATSSLKCPVPEVAWDFPNT